MLVVRPAAIRSRTIAPPAIAASLEQVRADRVEAMVTGEPPVRFERVQQIESGRRAVDHRSA
jgi:hypothetical protein